jgi:hypothetical protein
MDRNLMAAMPGKSIALVKAGKETKWAVRG